ncbi:hypothetical protein PR048_019405 [Dryococelus australis]|uniref:Ig-like domain-containing protein n=1 Tax=Dryococelus australis TaxID=614101 RepID=A0ABQ9H3F1_9NEOP|nr:hypothetical protein PR048_019405 [Dryococelus australis]
MKQRRNEKGGEREIPEKTQRPCASSGTIPHFENPGAGPLGTEPSSPSVTPGFSHVGIVLDRATYRRVFSGISRFPVLSFLRCSVITSITRTGSQDQISPLTDNIPSLRPTKSSKYSGLYTLISAPGLRLPRRTVVCVGNLGGSVEDGFARQSRGAETCEVGEPPHCWILRAVDCRRVWNGMKQHRNLEAMASAFTRGPADSPPQLVSPGCPSERCSPTTEGDFGGVGGAQKSEDGVGVMTKLPGFLAPSAGSLRTPPEVTAVDIAVRAIRLPAQEYEWQSHLKGACVSNMLAHKPRHLSTSSSSPIKSTWIPFLLSPGLAVIVFQGEEVQHNVSAGAIMSDQSLVLQGVSKASAGRYSCSADNAEGRGVSGDVPLRVMCKCLLGWGKGRSPIKPADQRHLPARFPLTKIRIDPAGHCTRCKAQNKALTAVRAPKTSLVNTQHVRRRIQQASTQLDEFQSGHIVILRGGRLDFSWHCSTRQKQHRPKSELDVVGTEGYTHTRREGSGWHQRATSRLDCSIVRQAISTPRVSLINIQGHVMVAVEMFVSTRHGDASRIFCDHVNPPPPPSLVQPDNPIFQQDIARPHTAQVSLTCLRDVTMLPCPATSPDLSPIEYVWGHIGWSLRPFVSGFSSG